MADVSTRRGKLSIFGTLPGRAILIAAIVRVVDFALDLALGREPAIIGVIDTIAALVIAAAGVYFIARGVAVMKRQLLWRVRRKLIISYFFIGVVPAILLFAFFSLAGVLLFFNFSAYLTRTEFRDLSDRVSGVARIAAAEIERAGGRDVQAILDRRETAAVENFPGISLAVVQVDGGCANRARGDVPGTVLARSGPWTHAIPPDSIPDWIQCPGFRGLVASSPEETAAMTNPAARSTVPERLPPIVAPRNTTAIVRGVAFPAAQDAGYAVVADVPINNAMRQIIREAIGVEFVDVVNVSKGIGVLHAPAPPEALSVPDPLPTQSPAYLEYRDWNTGSPGTLQTVIRIGIVQLYDRISNAPGPSENIVIYVLEFIGGLFLIIEVFALAFGFALAKSITGSVHQLFIGTERVRRGDFTGQISVIADDQLGELASSFNSMTASIEDLLRQAAEKKRLEEELRIAHEIQMSLLPQGPLDVPGMSISALCVPAREVGGDYYDVLRLSGDRIGLLIADVSGKGTSAALYMAELKGLILSLSRIHNSPRELLIQANRLIAEHLDSRSFITMTYAIIDPVAGTMTYARAGHTPLIYVPGPGNGSRAARILAPDGLVVGLKIDNGERFEALLQEETIPLRAGDVYLFFTDGITESMNAQDDFFGDSRLGRLVEQHADLPAEELRERVLREISAFVGGAPQHDDMTMILLKIEDTPAWRREATA